MKTIAYGLMFATFALAGCGTANTTPADSGTTAAADTGVTAPVDASTPVADAGSADAGPAYPAGPYGSRVGALFRPFTLQACNRDGADATWRFDGPDFWTSDLTVISIAAEWCVPCQMESSMLQAQIIDRYASQNVRFVQILVQNTDQTPISASHCNNWVNRFHLTSTPELMDPEFILQPFVPMTAFPGNIIVRLIGVWQDGESGPQTSSPVAGLACLGPARSSLSAPAAPK